MSSPAQYRELVLERLKYRCTQIIPYCALRAEAYWQEMADNLVLQIAFEIAGIRKKVEDIVYPTTWWDAVKDRWLPKWARRWAPVQYTRVVVERHSTVPDFALPKEYGPIRVGLYENKYNFSDPPEGEDE